MGERPDTPLSTTRHFLNFPLVYKLGTRLIGYFPRSVSYGFAGAIARMSEFLYRSAFQIVMDNLKLVFPVASREELQNLTREIFRNYSRYLVDYGRCAYMEHEKILEEISMYYGRGNLESATGMKKGIILLTAHLGNWELGGIFLGSYGLRTNVVTLPDEDPSIHRIRQWYRERFRVNTITIGDSPLSSLDLLKALRRGEVVAMLIDRYPEGPDSTVLDFFGRPTPFPRGPFILARITGAPIIVSFVVREGDAYRGIIEEPIVIPSEEEEPSAQRKVVKILEKYIIMYANQWYNFVPI